MIKHGFHEGTVIMVITQLLDNLLFVHCFILAYILFLYIIGRDMKALLNQLACIFYQNTSIMLLFGSYFYMAHFP